MKTEHCVLIVTISVVEKGLCHFDPLTPINKIVIHNTFKIYIFEIPKRTHISSYYSGLN